MVNPYKISNSEYGKKSIVSNRQSLSNNLEVDEDGQVVLKDNTKVPEFLFGVSLPLDTAINLIFNRIGKIVSQIPNATLHDALGQSLLIGCADAAEMDSLSKVNKHVTLFSLVPTSRFLVEKGGFYTTSIKNILPQ